MLWSRPIVLATTLPNKEGSWVLAKILQNPVLYFSYQLSRLCEQERVFLLFWFIYVNSNKRDKWFRPPPIPLALDN